MSKKKTPKPGGNTVMSPTHTVDPSTEAPQGGSPSLHDPSRPQFNAPPPPAVYYLTLENAEDLRSVLIADGAIPSVTTIWENGREIGFGSPPPALAKRGAGPQCLALKWYDEDGRPVSQQAGIVYYRLLELRSAADRLGNPIPKFKRTEVGIWA